MLTSSFFGFAIYASTFFGHASADNPLPPVAHASNCEYDAEHYVFGDDDDFALLLYGNDGCSQVGVNIKPPQTMGSSQTQYYNWPEDGESERWCFPVLALNDKVRSLFFRAKEDLYMVQLFKNDQCGFDALAEDGEPSVLGTSRLGNYYSFSDRLNIFIAECDPQWWYCNNVETGPDPVKVTYPMYSCKADKGGWVMDSLSSAEEQVSSVLVTVLGAGDPYINDLEAKFCH